MELKNKLEEEIEKRDVTPKGIFQSAKNSLNGIKSYAKEGKSIVIYILGVIVEILMGFSYNINGLEWILIICILGIILSVELINTAIENACDAITKEYNPLIKIAKDCGSGATFVIFLVAIILNIIIFLPKVIALF
ncbi:MAG: diacylglycerol kinase [Bacilli bacterium]|nr:diacylglycerol kinase [Bacilli bacterium]